MILLVLANEIGLTPKKVAGTNGGEYVSPCPECGGNDRFRIWPNKQNKNCIGSYWCRKCEISGDSLEFCRKFLGLSFAEAKEHVNATIPENRRPFVLRKKYNSFKPVVIKKQPASWVSRAEEFVKKTHSEIWNRPEILKHLGDRGLPEEAVRECKIGWNSKELFCDRRHWGLETTEGKSNKIWLPKGIVIPSIEKGYGVARLKIRRHNWVEGDKAGKYIIVPGSMNGFNIVGNKKNNVTLVVESEFDALAVCHAVGDFVVAVAIGGSTKNPDNVTDLLAKRKNATLLICPDNDEGGAKLLEKWRKMYPHAKPYPVPIGKDIGEAITQGFDIRAWLSKFNPANKWSKEDKELIDWCMDYISKRTVTRKAYTKLENEILLGPGSPRAITGELQEGLQLMRQLVEEEIG